ncbi:carbohydrate ABC transporter permease [Bosea thiooxidans]|nr:sugar ABC transporter permease [Bosea sp. (in: a-proteobacteria)]
MMKRLTPWLWVGPSALPLLLLSAVPIALLGYISLTSFEIGYTWSDREFVGLDNYRRLLSGREVEFWPAVWLSLVVTAVSVVAKTLLGLGVATLLSKKLRFEYIATTLIILPMAVNPAIAGLMWKLMLSYDFGIVNAAVEGLFGVKIVWLGQSYALLSVLLVLVWMHFPLSALMILAGFRNIAPEPLEAARLDGCSDRQVFWLIVVPQLRPVILSSSIFQAILAFQAFGPIFTLTDGGPGNATTILPLYVYKTAFTLGSVGLAAAAAVILVLIITALSGLMVATGRKGQAT